ncbi:hypothetical protein [Rhizobium miluonense]|uniref:hypothetical protein n=1 Tax=Rhizobium miluonense TaxID=411945 RepID=UPI00135668E3|nr:hypothetical protein [Rhizobium miluonense]
MEERILKYFFALNGKIGWHNSNFIKRQNAANFGDDDDEPRNEHDAHDEPHDERHADDGWNAHDEPDDGRHADDESNDDAHDADDDGQNDLQDDAQGHGLRDDADGRHGQGHVHGMLQAHDVHDVVRDACHDDVRQHDDVLHDGSSLIETISAAKLINGPLSSGRSDLG